MHEVGIMQNTLDLAIQAAERQGATRIHAIRMRIGEMSGVVADALEFAFEVLRQGTPAEAAKLEVERVAVVCFCTACDREFDYDPHGYECPLCGAPAAAIHRGRELELVSVEVS